MILNSLIQGFILGVGAAVPLGPINILIMDRAIQNYKSAVFIGLGALSADITYLFLILLGLVTLFNNTLVVEMLGFFGSAFLFFIAYMIFQLLLKDTNLNASACCVRKEGYFIVCLTDSFQYLMLYY